MEKDPYRPLHKAIRNRLFEVGKLAGTTDYSDDASSQKFKAQFDGLLMFLEHHGQHEDDVIHPLLTKRDIVEINEIAKQHAALEQELETVKTTLDLLISNDEKNKWKVAHEFYLCYQHFVSSYLAHIHDEETIIPPLLQQHYSDAEFDELAKADFGSAEPEQLRPMLGRMLPAFNVSDMALILSDIQRVVPQKTFQQFCQVFQDELPSEEWEKTKALLAL